MLVVIINLFVRLILIYLYSIYLMLSILYHHLNYKLTLVVHGVRLVPLVHCCHDLVDGLGNVVA